MTQFNIKGCINKWSSVIIGEEIECDDIVMVQFDAENNCECEIQIIYSDQEKIDDRLDRFCWNTVHVGFVSANKKIISSPRFGKCVGFDIEPTKYKYVFFRVKLKSEDVVLRGSSSLLSNKTSSKSKELFKPYFNSCEILKNEIHGYVNVNEWLNRKKFVVNLNKKIYAVSDFVSGNFLKFSVVKQGEDAQDIKIKMQGWSVDYCPAVEFVEKCDALSFFEFKLPHIFISKNLTKNFASETVYPSVVYLDFFLGVKYLETHQILVVPDSTNIFELKLNVGCGTDLIESWINLDRYPCKSNNSYIVLWNFLDYFGFLDDNTVSAITVSHFLMYLPKSAYQIFLSECLRVLKRGGVIRITEDNSNFHKSFESSYLISPTNPEEMRFMLESVGFRVYDQDYCTTIYSAKQIMRNKHMELFDLREHERTNQTGVYFIEGLKPRYHYSLKFGFANSLFDGDMKSSIEKSRFSSIYAPCVASHESHFMADPFLVRASGRIYCFYESRLYDRAVIAVLELKDTEIIDLGICLQEDFHLSFPYVFQIDDVMYMLPESSSNNDLRLYVADSFPLSWSLVRVIKSESKNMDSCIFVQDGIFYLFTFDGVGLNLFFSSDFLTDDFVKHPCSPIPCKKEHARLAGKINLIDGKIYRFSQDCSVTYGKSISVHHISNLSPDHYEEVLVEDNYLNNDDWGYSVPWNNKIHHLDVVTLEGWSHKYCYVIDGTDHF